MVSPTRNDFRFVWPLNRPAAISETTNKPGSVPRLVPSYNHQISPDNQDRTLLVLILALAPTQHNLCILTAMAAATTTQLTFFPLVLRLSDPRRHHSCKFLSLPTQSSSRLALRVTTTTALGSDMLGDFGARDPFPAELESGFGEKVLGNVDTEHKILIPKLSSLSLAEQDCSPASPFQTPMSADDAKKLLKKVVGWRLLEEEGGLKLQCLWKLRDFKCGVELINRIYKVTEAAGHFPNLHLEQPNQVRAELWTSSIGGLSMNDFIVAAKLDQIRTSDLAPRKRIWA